MTPEEFNAAFDGFHASAFRLECLQTYAVSAEDERLRAFREGLPRPERSVRTDPWLRRIAASTIAGKSWTRIRLMRHPLTEYMQYGLISLVESQAVGEQVRIADLNAHPELEQLGPDFWLFDAGETDEFAVVIHYDENGALLGLERSDDVGWCKEQRDTAMAYSVSLAEYVAEKR